MTNNQQLTIWQLLLTGEEPKISELRPKLSPAQRTQLQQAGLIEIEKRGRASHVILTDKAWLWAMEQDVTGMGKSKSPVAAQMLENILQRLTHFLQLQEISLAEFLYPQPSVAPEPITVMDTIGIEQRIRSAYTQLSGGTYDVRIRLADLRLHLADISREQLDSTLRAMQLEGKLVLMHLDDPLDRNNTDDEAAINIGGRTHHIVYLRENIT